MNGPVAHVIPYLGRDFGGPVVAMAAMAAGLAELGEEVTVFSTHRPHEGARIDLPPACRVVCTADAGWGGLRHSPQLWAELQRAAPRLIHSHGLWTDVHRCAATVARRLGVPHVLGPCGMLGEVALQRSRWKKALARRWFQDRALREAACLVANAADECRDIRRNGLKNPVAVIPNPVAGPEAVPERLSGTDFRHRYGLGTEKKLLLFLGRIHPTKGVRRLVEVWNTLCSLHGEWQLVLAGPDEGNYRLRVEDDLARLGCRDSVTLTGALDDCSKWGALAAADLFVMPSRHENFCIAIVEALLAGIPVVTTTGTPWRSLEDAAAGWHVDPEPAALGKALASAMALDEATRREMGRRGRHLGENFSVTKVGGMLLQLYAWLAGQAETPEFIHRT